MHIIRRYPRTLWAALATSVICAAPALAQPLAMHRNPALSRTSIFQQVMPAERERVSAALRDQRAGG